MKRESYLFDQAINFRTLLFSARKAAKGKKNKTGVASFMTDIEHEVNALIEEIFSKSYLPRPYQTFMVNDPKTRKICAADFRDRVVHHAVCTVLEPVFEKVSIFDSYACRKGKGNLRAVKRAESFMGKTQYYLKMDIQKFFDSIDHAVLKRLIKEKIKDTRLLSLIDIFIDCPVPWTASGKGLPIGNLTSQHFANFYLSGLDHYIKEQLKAKYYIRYMDDMILFFPDKSKAWQSLAKAADYLSEKLDLTLNQDALCVAPCYQGLSFLGFRIYPSTIRLSQKGVKRFKRKVIALNTGFTEKRIAYDTWHNQMASLISHAKQADSQNFRMAFFKGREFESDNRVLRGGSWNNSAANCRSAIRNRNEPSNRNNNIGFRLSSSVTQRDALYSRI